MRALLDVDALIALVDEGHVHHQAILDWFAMEENRSHGFATCGITQIGAIRVISNKGYNRPLPPHEVAAALRGITREAHRYLGIPTPCEGAIRWKSTTSAQSTDATLLSTAVAHGCRLVTFDSGISLACVEGAKRENLVILGR
jgi:toxin-antitoxin system PIN domain toxin